ncbi:complement component C1q receptor-like [Huso huso]|uniref:Complement component C1q receptor-like n=1 Tax=Huso huso TaxID=61971 RepID=A0ABR0ZVV4_HUSHU
MMVYFILLLQVLLLGINGVEVTQMETLCSSSACYTVHLERVDFERALQNCKANGGNLATVKNSEEASELQSLLSRISAEQPTGELQFWIGLHLRKGDCIHALKPLKGFTWLSVDEVAQYSNWKEEPMTTCTAQRCVSLQYNPSSVNIDNFKWSDRTCTKDADGYLCKFNFKGMCKTIHLAGPGEVLYTTPFVTRPLNSNNAFLALVPHGTSASVDCKYENDLYGICNKNKDGSFGWTMSGPFCDSHKLGCSFRNGGCDHVCVDEGAGRHRCECNDGYQLEEDELSCIIRDYCQPLLCEYQCIAHFKGFECKCPSGFELTDNQKNCTDIDECLNKPCDQLCVNTAGSFICQCTQGYELVNGRCHDVDECIQSACSQGCLNSPGSFACYCTEGYILAENGQFCVDIDECQGYINPCEEICTNTPGSFKCSCKEKFTMASDEVSCIPEQNLDTTIAAEGTNRPVNIPNNKDNLTKVTLAPTFTSDGISSSERNKIQLTRTTDQHWHIPTTATVKNYPPNEDHHDLSSESGNQGHLFNGADKSLVLASVLGFVAILLLLIAAVTSLVLCRRKVLRKNANKRKTAMNNYCWMPSGNKTKVKRTKDCINVELHNTKENV